MSETLAMASVSSLTQLSDTENDYYVEKEGLRFAGTHLLLDMWGAENLADVDAVDAILREAVAATGATLLRIDLHSFDNSGGVTGVAILAESHMSIHTWPETGYVAIDVFVCGNCDPYRAIPILKNGFAPTSVQLSEHKRGLVF
ncbi:MAG: adenosylmethionine decarboxylase [Proteobacteria bacterium]|nr:adenosylmethionine decarboxylase [Pseudomonadota bacterium]